MKNLISRNLKGWLILVLFLSAGIFYTIMLTITIPKVMSFAGGMKILDMMPTGYDTDYVNTLLNSLGEEGRHAYLFNQIPLDMIYPLLFGISLCLIIAFLLKRLGNLDSPLSYISILPLFSALFDYCENIGIIVLLKSYPDISELTAKITNVFSILKSSTTTVSFTILIVLLLILVIKKPWLKPNNSKT